MGSLHSESFEDFSEEQYGSLAKRTRFETAPSNQQLSSGNNVSNVQPSQYNPLDEPSPLGLRLRKSLSLLDLIQMTISQNSSGSIRGNPTETAGQGSKKDAGGTAASSASDKLKASNFPALLLRIGSWEYISKYEGDLVAKCYFAKHKLVWEVLDGGLKSKLEIQWSDITALRADMPDDGPSTLTLVLARQPSFFRETNPQPRKHTLWQATTDFTDGQASMHKLHVLQFAPGILNKHYEKLIQCDMRLGFLSQQPETVLDSPYFKTKASAYENSGESSGDGGNLQPHAAKGSPISPFQEVDSLACPHLRASEFEKNPLAIQGVSKEAASPSSVMDTHAIEGNKSSTQHVSEGLRPSMSMTDLMNHIGNCISEQVTSGTLPSTKASECHDILENISQVLLSDSQFSTGLDERSLMKKVNSLCNLLQDPAIACSALADGENRNEAADPAKSFNFGFVNDSIHSTHEKTGGSIMQASGAGLEDGKPAPGLPRKDSFSDLLLHLPRIASLPRFSNLLYGIAEDDECQSP